MAALVAESALTRRFGALLDALLAGPTRRDVDGVAFRCAEALWTALRRRCGGDAAALAAHFDDAVAQPLRAQLAAGLDGLETFVVRAQAPASLLVRASREADAPRALRLCDAALRLDPRHAAAAVERAARPRCGRRAQRREALRAAKETCEAACLAAVATRLLLRLASQDAPPAALDVDVDAIFAGPAVRAAAAPLLPLLRCLERLQRLERAAAVADAAELRLWRDALPLDEAQAAQLRLGGLRGLPPAAPLPRDASRGAWWPLLATRVTGGLVGLCGALPVDAADAAEAPAAADADAAAFAAALHPPLAASGGVDGGGVGGAGDWLRARVGVVRAAVAAFLRHTAPSRNAADDAGGGAGSPLRDALGAKVAALEPQLRRALLRPAQRPVLRLAALLSAAGDAAAVARRFGRWLRADGGGRLRWTAPLPAFAVCAFDAALARAADDAGLVAALSGARDAAAADAALRDALYAQLAPPPARAAFDAERRCRRGRRDGDAAGGVAAVARDAQPPLLLDAATALAAAAFDALVDALHAEADARDTVA
eukprot:gene10637-7569_t